MGDKKTLDNLVRALALTACALFAVILSGTIWAFATGSVGKARASGSGGRESLSARELAGAKRGDPSPETLESADPAGKTAVFADVGVLRARTGDKAPVTVVVTPYFPYPAADVAFREELVSKTRSLRTAMLDWFAMKRVDELESLGEAAVKRELLDRINARLTLGRIEKLYFSEYFVVE
jgi:flagellar basal body-associated protein FliL